MDIIAGFVIGFFLFLLGIAFISSYGAEEVPEIDAPPPEGG